MHSCTYCSPLPAESNLLGCSIAPSLVHANPEGGGFIAAEGCCAHLHATRDAAGWVPVGLRQQRPHLVHKHLRQQDIPLLT